MPAKIDEEKPVGDQASQVLIERESDLDATRTRDEDPAVVAQAAMEVGLQAEAADDRNEGNVIDSGEGEAEAFVESVTGPIDMITRGMGVASPAVQI